jgi:hypothetical protein
MTSRRTRAERHADQRSQCDERGDPAPVNQPVVTSTDRHSGRPVATPPVSATSAAVDSPNVHLTTSA